LVAARRNSPVYISSLRPFIRHSNSFLPKTKTSSPLAVGFEIQTVHASKNSTFIGGSRIFLRGAQGQVHPDMYSLHSSEGPTV